MGVSLCCEFVKIFRTDFLIITLINRPRNFTVDLGEQ